MYALELAGYIFISIVGLGNSKMGTLNKDYNFKSVGKTPADLAQTPGIKIGNIMPVGLMTPLKFSETSTSPFEMHTNLENQIVDNLKNLILTNNGERLIQTNLGANILPLAFELTNSDIDEQVMGRIKSNVAIFMPYINLLNFKPFAIPPEEPNHVAKLGFVVTFTIPSISTAPRAIEIFLNAVG